MRAIKHQLIIFGLFIIYIIIRLIDISDISLTLWQDIYWGNFVKDSLLLIGFFTITYFGLNAVRRQPKIGPRIISSKKLKTILYPSLIIAWLAVVIHAFFDSFKKLLPFKLLPFYQFSNFMDETISHVFMYLPFIAIFLILSFLEIERPLTKSLKKTEIIFLSILSGLIGILWGLNLTEGRLAFVTSFPAMLFSLTLILYFIKKHKLNLRIRPWNLTAIITTASGSISLTVWNIIFKSTPELFAILKWSF